MGSSGHSKIEADGAVTCPAAAAGVHLASSPGLTSGQYGKEYEFYIHVDQSRQDTCVRGLSKRDSKTEAESRPESLPTEYVGNLHGLPCLFSGREAFCTVWGCAPVHFPAGLASWEAKGLLGTANDSKPTSAPQGGLS